MNELSNKRIVIVGIFVFIGLIFLAGGILLVGNLRKAFEKKIEVVAIFNDVAGLQMGNNVWLSGVKIGTVNNLAFFGTSKVKVRILVEDKAKQYIPINAKVKISSDGFIGNKILVIYGGTPDARNIVNGDTLAVEETFSSEDAINTLQENNKNLLVITTNLKALSAKLLSGEGTVGKLLNDNAVYNNIQAATAALASALNHTKEMTLTLDQFSAKLNKKGTLGNDLVNDTVIYNSLKSTVLNLQQISDSTSILISNLKSDEQNPNSALGVMLKDNESGASLKETIKNLQTSSQKLDENLEALQHSALLRGYFKKKDKAAKKD